MTNLNNALASAFAYFEAYVNMIVNYVTDFHLLLEVDN